MRSSIIALVVCLFATLLPGGALSAADTPATVPVPTTADAGAAASSSAADGASSRYQFYNGYWWYWTPDNRWLCYVNGQWVNPAPPVQAGVPAYPYQAYTVAPPPYYGPYPYGYGYPAPYYAGGIYIGGGYGGYWHGGYGYGGYGYGGHHH